MSRQIKFRAKTLNYDPMTMPEWAYGFYYQELHQGKIHHLITDGAHTFEVDENTLGQFTGLVDNNGKEIYENDIIKYSYARRGIEKANGRVYYAEQFCATYFDIYNEGGFTADEIIWQILNGAKIEVIGSTLNHADLLKGSQNEI